MSTPLELTDEEIERRPKKSKENDPLAEPGPPIETRPPTTPSGAIRFNSTPIGNERNQKPAAKGEILEWNLSVVPPLVRDENGWRTVTEEEIQEEQARRETVTWSDVRDKLVEGKSFSVTVDDPLPPAALASMFDPPDLPERGPASFEEALDATYARCRTVMLNRQRKYGKENILEFGQHGVFLRSRDKSNRLKNVYFDKDGNPRPITEDEHGDESIDDSWLDTANYGLIALMLRAGTFTLPLKGDD